MAEWDFVVSGFSKGQLLVQTTHKGEASMQVEVEAWKARMRRGECDKIVISDQRPKWVREQWGSGPLSKDLTETITDAGKGS